MMISSLALVLVLTLTTVLYKIHLAFFSYWKRRGIPFVEPSFLWGNLKDVMSRKVSFGILTYELYKKSTATFVEGIYFFYRPALLVTSAELAMQILVRDFHSFHDRGKFYNPKTDPMSSHLFNMPGNDWRNLRVKLTPTFTTGKLKSMMSTILVEGEVLKKYLDPKAALGEVVEMKDLLERYSLNIIASIGFGLDVDTINDPQNEFTNVKNIVNGPGLITSLRLLLGFFCPSILYFFNARCLPKEATEYFVGLTTDTFEHRTKNHIIRKDFIQLLMQLRNNGQVSEDGDWAVGKIGGMKALTIDECAAQSYLFYLAGFDTSATTFAYCLYELVRNPDIMKHLQKEIDETLSRHNNEITYEAIQEMTYLELCILETVRKYPALPLLNRICTKEYAIPNSNLTIPNGTPIVISLLGLGRDERYFPQPERFWPERFCENDKHYDENAFMPFGEGPRKCIGIRLGKIVAKVGLVQLLRSFDFDSIQKGEIEFHNYSVFLSPKGGIEMRVVKRSQITAN